MKTFTKTMKLVCKRIVVLLMALCLMTTGSVFLGAFCKNNIAAAEEATEPVWTVLDDGDWATLQAKLFEGGYYKLDSNFIDTSPNSGKSGTRVDYKFTEVGSTLWTLL